MTGRDFLTVARDLVLGSTEAHWRSAIGRAYYALLLECREALSRWGLTYVARDVHTSVRLRFFMLANPDLLTIARILEELNELRGKADYRLQPYHAFSSNIRALKAIQDVSDRLDLLDAIDADPVRRANAINIIRAKYP